MKPSIAWVKGTGLVPWESIIFEEIAKRGNKVTGICAKGNPYGVKHVQFPVTQLSEGSKFNKIPLVSHALQYAFPVNRHLIGLKKELKKYDIAHTCENFNVFAYQCVKSKVPTVVTVWENIPFIHERMAYKRYKKIVSSGAAHFIAVSEYSKRMLLLEGVSEDKITVIYPGIDVRRFRPLPKNQSIINRYRLNGKKIILHVASLVHGNKGAKELLFALKLLDDPTVQLVISGQGKLKPELENLARRLNVKSQVTFIDGYPYEKIHELYSIADVVALPSIPIPNWQEQFGYVLAEAMACGKPVISSYCGAIADVMPNNVAGLLVSPGNYFELFQALEKILYSKTLQAKMGSAGRKVATERYDAKNTAAAYEKVYEKVMKK